MTSRHTLVLAVTAFALAACGSQSPAGAASSAEAQRSMASTAAVSRPSPSAQASTASPDILPQAALAAWETRARRSC